MSLLCSSLFINCSCLLFVAYDSDFHSCLLFVEYDCDFHLFHVKQIFIYEVKTRFIFINNTILNELFSVVFFCLFFYFFIYTETTSDNLVFIVAPVQ